MINVKKNKSHYVRTLNKRRWNLWNAMQSNVIAEGQRAHATSKRQESKETKDIITYRCIPVNLCQYTCERTKAAHLFALMINCVQMAHALRRISYATCEPRHAQFSFLAREPRAHFSIQYCHSFVTESAEQRRNQRTVAKKRGNLFALMLVLKTKRLAILVRLDGPKTPLESIARAKLLHHSKPSIIKRVDVMKLMPLHVKTQLSTL
ncbi:hypothetical protein HZH66_003058 [Vespula vulgaris]|uniref:Uncharacterized protein n=2 Tax=Vespula TaxID=7451 RepID=A0A834KMK8_VESVU|nr:hypothetical protein HZH66_003058 [Vespula vulgaris]